MAPIYEGTASCYGEPESWTEELFAATGARLGYWIALAVAVVSVVWGGP